MAQVDRVDISVVVPAYNEEARLTATLPILWKGLGRRFSTFEVIVVDDGSQDRTAQVAESFGLAHPEVRVIRCAMNRGKGHAVRQGMLAARGEVLLFSDADLSTPVREVRKLLQALEEGCDIAIGSRAVGDAKILKYQPIYRVLLGKTFNKIVRLLGVRGFRDTQCGFKCFRRQAAMEIFRLARINGFSFDVEVLFLAGRLGLTVREVGVLWKNSPASKVHPVFHSLQMLKELLLLRIFLILGFYGRQSPLRTRIEA
jgi:dolichyl-phosphate beta-glucosyltransferase